MLDVKIYNYLIVLQIKKAKLVAKIATLLDFCRARMVAILAAKAL
jgi:hypothetical protein